ncbi:MAG: spore coat associated protein CotJA [Ruminococcaceae bacterium]|nr:spore coat associated protein CotJA [Oscillospiraceae bacterium]
MNTLKDLLNGAGCPAEHSGGGDGLFGRSLAMVYSPHQLFDGLYTPEVGLCHGTIFIELDKPFWGAGRLK